MKLNTFISITVTVALFICAGVFYFITNKNYSQGTLLIKANSYFTKGNFFQSSRYYKKLISMGAKDDQIYKKAATSLMNIGDYDKAIHYLDKISKTADRAEVYYNLAYNYYTKSKISNSQDELQKAISYLEQSISINPKNEMAYRLMGDICENNYSFEQARNWYQKAIDEKMSDGSEFYNLIAHTYFKENNFEKAIQTYQQAIKINNKNISAYYSLGTIYIQQEKFDQAEDIYKKSLQFYSDSVTPYFNLGFIYYTKKNYEQALQYYKKALAIDVNDNFVNYYIAKVYNDMGEKEQAVQFFKTAAYLGNEEAIKELEKLTKGF